MNVFEQELISVYEQKPVIIILEEAERNQVERILQSNKFKYQTSGDANELIKIRDWDYGVLLLSPMEGRGVDTRFRRDSHVLILAQVKTYHELQQMIGCSSRTRGVC